MLLNINDTVRVKLTNKGHAIHAANHALWCAVNGMKNFPYQKPAEDDEGWSEWQVWELMHQFGSHLYAGGKLPFETAIEIKEKQQ